MDKNSIEDLASKLYQALPTDFASLGDDLQQKFKSIITATFQSLDLVTREEFEVQKKVLLKTREKVEKCEKILEDLNKED